MDDTVMMLDGNALAGMLSEVFAADMTAARSACAWCGVVATLAEQRLYMNPGSPGAVLRCHACDGRMLVLVRRGDRLRVGMPGVRWMDVEATG